MALAGRPRLLLLDEPAAGSVRRRGRPAGRAAPALPRTVAVLLVEHRLDLVYALADTVTVLRDGQTLAAGTAGRDPYLAARCGRPTPTGCA